MMKVALVTLLNALASVACAASAAWAAIYGGGGGVVVGIILAFVAYCWTARSVYNHTDK